MKRIFELETRQQTDLTAITVMVKLDVETCYTLSEAFKELGAALYAAQSTYTARRRFEAEEPRRRAFKETQRAAIASRLRDLIYLPPRKAVSVIARELDLKWDTVDLERIEIRRAERREAALKRDREIMQLSKSGSTAKSIGERLGLSKGTVWNILTRLRKGSPRPEDSESKAV